MSITWTEDNSSYFGIAATAKTDTATASVGTVITSKGTVWSWTVQFFDGRESGGDAATFDKAKDAAVAALGSSFSYWELSATDPKKQTRRNG